MNLMPAIVEVLGNRSVLDVLAPGYVDRSDIHPEFRPMPMTVLLRLDQGFLRPESVGQYEQLLMTWTAEAGVPAEELELEDEDEAAFASYGDFLLGDGHDAWHCSALRYYTDSRSQPDAGVVKCAERVPGGSPPLRGPHLDFWHPARRA